MPRAPSTTPGVHAAASSVGARPSRRAGRPADSAALAAVPTVLDGARGIRFVEAAVASSRANGQWVAASLAGI